MKPDNFGKGDPQFLEMLEEALIEGISEREDGIRVAARSSSIVDIQRLLDVCYHMALNPLPHLRKSFPKFTWRHQANHHLAENLVIASESDFTWHLHRDILDDIVIASRVDPEPKRLKFYCVPFSQLELPKLTELAKELGLREGADN